jgi:hypothetical protein
MSRVGTHGSSSAERAGVLSNLFGGRSDADEPRMNDALTIILDDRYAVMVQGIGVGPGALAGALKRIDLSELASASR